MVLLGVQDPVALKDEIEKKLNKERGKSQHLLFSLFQCNSLVANVNVCDYLTMLQCLLCSLSLLRGLVHYTINHLMAFHCKLINMIPKYIMGSLLSQIKYRQNLYLKYIMPNNI